MTWRPRDSTLRNLDLEIIIEIYLISVIKVRKAVAFLKKELPVQLPIHFRLCQVDIRLEQIKLVAALTLGLFKYKIEFLDLVILW